MSTRIFTLLRIAGVSAIAAAALLMPAGRADAQARPAASSTSQNKAVVPVYDGPPIYLDEPTVVAEPTIVRREKVPPEKYPDGTVRVEREVALYSDNHLEADGTYREYHPNGKPFIEGQYQRGRQHGEWTYYFEDGKVNRKTTYNSGQPDGAWDIFRADGTLSAKRSFKNGIRDGEWITYDPAGKKPIREEHYVTGKADGIWKVWSPDGKLKQQVGFKEGQRHGTTIEWNDKGEKLIEINYADNKPHGPAMQRLPDGRSIFQEYKEGRLIKQEKR